MDEGGGELDPRERLALVTSGAALDVARLPDELARLEAASWRAVGAARDPEQDGLDHPSCATFLAWSRRLEALGLATEAAEVVRALEELRARQLRACLDAFGRPSEADGPERWFDALADWERARRHDPTPRSGADGEPGNPSRALRAGLERAVARQAPSAATRTGWVDRLVDEADEALAAASELPSERAEASLAGVAERLSEHLRAIEHAPGPGRTRLARRLARVRAEQEERALERRLHRLFGRVAVRRWDRAVLGAILLALALLVATLFVPLDAREERALLWLDSALCLALLWDFGVRATLARWRWSYLLRHVWIDFLPALPFGLVLLLAEGGEVAAPEAWSLTAVRLLWLGRMARVLRGLLPILTSLRAIGFLLRGCDRAVRAYGHLLNRDVILYPTASERRQAREPRAGSASARLAAELDRRWVRELEQAAADARPALCASRLAVLQGLPPVPARPAGAGGRSRGDLCADELLDRLAGIDATRVEGEVGASVVERLGRGLRLLARSPLRFLPLLSWLAAPASRSDAELTAHATRALGSRLRRALGWMQAVQDLSGTLTPADLVGRVGGTLVRRTARPAIRLLALGLLYGLLTALAQLFGLDLSSFATRVYELIGTTLFVLGSLCLFFLALGFWLQRLGSDASAFHEQVAAAQFVHQSESIKTRAVERDADLLEARVFAPERELRGAGLGDRASFLAGLRALVLEGAAIERSSLGFDPIARCVLLYRDVQDGALLGESDTRSTSHLLGNQALAWLREGSWAIGSARNRELERIDLTRRRGWFAGPYFWFHLVTRAMTHGAAQLIVDYGEHAIPLDELASATGEERERFARWLGGAGGEEASVARPGDRRQISTAFTALHFLDDAAERDAAIAGRFGPAVLAQLRRDRRALFRRVFGTWPMHLLPREERVLNLREVYRVWFEGGRVLLLPPRLFLQSLRQVGRALRFLGDAVRRIRTPRLLRGPEGAAESDFAVALRKVDRLRRPVAWQALRLRAALDVEYLGLAWPGGPEPAATYRADLEFLALDARSREEIEAERERAERDVTRLAELVGGGLLERVAARLGLGASDLGPEHRRAAAIALRADLEGVRSHLLAGQVLGDLVRRAQDDERAGEPLARRVWRLRWPLRRAFARTWAAHGTGGARVRRRAWRSLARTADGSVSVLRALASEGERVAQRGEELLAEALRHPSRLGEMLVTLRAVQTLTLIELANYREHVHRLGGYADEGDAPPAALAACHSKLPS